MQEAEDKAKGNPMGRNQKNLLLKMLNLRCLEDNHVEINVLQTDANSELVLRKVVRVIVLHLFALAIFRVMFLIVLYSKPKYFLTIFMYYLHYSSAKVTIANFISILH